MNNNLFDLKGKTALVTGGNSGLGLGYATGLAKAGADIMIWGRNAQKNRNAVKQLEIYGGRVLTAQVDVSSEAQVVQGMHDAVVQLGKLDCLVSNAGVFVPVDSFLELTTAKYEELLGPSQHGGFFTMREAVRHMAERAKAGGGGGSIIVCGSLSVPLGCATMEHYAAAKGALASMMRCIAVEFGPLGIRANMVLPGLYKTDLGGPDQQQRPAHLVEMENALYSAFTNGSPLRRLGLPSDLEGVAAFLASDASSFITGSMITVDGGWSAKLI